MVDDTLDARWIDAFVNLFERCRIQPGEIVVILSETHTRALNRQLTELALNYLKIAYFQIVVPGADPIPAPVVRSSGASPALDDQPAAVEALCLADVVIDLTVEGLMHARQVAKILKSGARIQNISNEHPEALARLLPTDQDRERVSGAVKRCRQAARMSVRSEAGTDLDVDMKGAITAGVFGWTDRPGTLAHWPGGIVVSFPQAGSVQGRLVLDAGDLNLTFKRYIESPVSLSIVDDHIDAIEGRGADAALMRNYLAAFGDRAAYATSHVGWGMNPGAGYEAMTMYDKRDTNGTELRAVAGNFLYSTGANEFANRFTRGHFDLPVMNCTIALDGTNVVDRGRLCE